MIQVPKKRSKNNMFKWLNASSLVVEQNKYFVYLHIYVYIYIPKKNPLNPIFLLHLGWYFNIHMDKDFPYRFSAAIYVHSLHLLSAWELSSVSCTVAHSTNSQNTVFAWSNMESLPGCYIINPFCMCQCV